METNGSPRKRQKGSSLQHTVGRQLLGDVTIKKIVQQMVKELIEEAERLDLELKLTSL